MKIRTKIIDWFYRRYGSRDIVAMTRRQLLGTTFNSSGLDFNDLPVNEKTGVSSQAKGIIENPVFKMAIDIVKDRFMKHARDQADGELQMFCDRFSINGADMVWEQMKFMSELEGEQKEQADDPYSLMES